MARLDPHSYADTTQPQTRSIELSLKVDFASRTLSGEAVLRFREAGAGSIDLDTRDLHIESGTALEGAPLLSQLAAPEPILGLPLPIDPPAPPPALRPP